MGSDEIRDGERQAAQADLDHTSIVGSLLDLQRHNRGEAGEPDPPRTESAVVVTDKQPAVEPPALDEGSVAVAAGDDLWVVETPVAPAPAADPGAESLAERLARIEGDLQGVFSSIERVHGEIDEKVAALREDVVPEVEELRGRVAGAEASLIEVLGAQREELTRTLDRHFERIERTISGGRTDEEKPKKRRTK